MFHNNVLFVLVVVYGLCSIGESGVVAPKKPLRSHLTGGYKNSEVQNNVSELDCSQFRDDLDVLRQLPFLLVINPATSDDYKNSTATMNEEETFVKSIAVRYEKTVPSSIYCLSNLDTLHIETTPFENGIVPDALANFKTLKTLMIYDSPIKKMTEQLGTLINLDRIQLINCSLTYLPDLSNLQKLNALDVPCNNISRIGGLPSVHRLDLTINLLSEIPVLKNPENLEALYIDYNPLKSALPILLYKNLEVLFMKFATLTSIPPAIDQLQKLAYLAIAGNKLTSLPTSIFNLRRLEYFNVMKNLFSADHIASIKKEFEKSHPKTKLMI